MQLSSLICGFVLIAVVGAVRSPDPKNCIPCNDGADKVVVELEKFIRSLSPVIRDDIEYCYNLSVDGAYTLKRDGNICSEKLNDADDCSLQTLDIKFLWINFTCEANIEQIKNEIQNKQGKGVVKMAGGVGTQVVKTKLGKRGLFDKAKLPAGVAPPKTYLVGHWTEVGVIGELKLCKKARGKSEVDPFSLKKHDFDNLLVSCSGDPMIKDVCDMPEGMDQIKRMIGAPISFVAGDIVREMILTGKCDMPNKFKCG